MAKTENESLENRQWQRLFDELDESVRIAELTGWIGEEEANRQIDEMQFRAPRAATNYRGNNL